jgi:hypothetical protein
MTPTLHTRCALTGALAVAFALALAGPAPAQPIDLRSPDARAAASCASQAPSARDAQDLRSPDARDAASCARPAPIIVTPTAAEDPAPAAADIAPSGFAWGDAAIGAGIAIGMLLLLAGCAAALHRRHRPEAGHAVAP